MAYKMHLPLRRLGPLGFGIVYYISYGRGSFANISDPRQSRSYIEAMDRPTILCSTYSTVGRSTADIYDRGSYIFTEV